MMARPKQTRAEPGTRYATGPAATTSPPPPWRAVADGVLVAVRLTPKSSSDAITGIAGGPDGAHLVAKVRALPSDGAANDALVKLMAKWIGLPQRDVTLAAGGKSRLKMLHLRGDSADLVRRLAEKLP